MGRLLALLILLASPLQAQWLETAAHATFAVDEISTAYYLAHVPTAYELNPILGRHPSVLGIAAYGAFCHAAIHFMPKKVKPWFQAAVVVVEVWTIWHNPCPLHNCGP